jgi:hypothetical protein
MIAAALVTIAFIAPVLLSTEIVRITHALVGCDLGLSYTPIVPAPGPSSAATRVFQRLPAALERSIANWSGHSLLDRKRCGRNMPAEASIHVFIVLLLLDILTFPSFGL